MSVDLNNCRNNYSRSVFYFISTGTRRWGERAILGCGTFLEQEVQWKLNSLQGCRNSLKLNSLQETQQFATQQGSRDGAVVEHLPPTQASHQCGPGSIPGLGVKCGLSLLLVLVLAPRGFSPGSPVFPSPQKPTFPNSNSIWNPRATGLSVISLLSVTLVK